MTLARIMWDSTTPAKSIPRTAQIVAGYVNGDFAWSAQDWALFPHSMHVRISVKGIVPCDVYDIEKGDYLPSDAPTLLQVAHDAGVTNPTLYFSRDAYDEVRQHVPMPGHTWSWWCADYTGQPHEVVMPDGGVASAVQYANPTFTGANYDLSAVYDTFWPIFSIPTKGPLSAMPAIIAKDGDTIIIHAIGAGAREGQLLEFRRKVSDPSYNDVRDITDGIAVGTDPNGPYTVSAV